MTHPAPYPLPMQPRQVLLFTGHRIDTPDRIEPRFPPDKERAAAARIADALDALAADEHDVGLTQGAAGGDILFAETCARRGTPVQLMLPLPEAQFVEQSVLTSIDGDAWRRRYLAVRSALPWPPQVLDSTTERDDPFERCNRWLLATALAHGADKLHLICLWNGSAGDGPGGTAHMVREVQRLHGEVIWIDTRTL